MSTIVLVRGTLHQRHSRVPTNDATSSHRLHSIERERVIKWFTEKNIHDVIGHVIQQPTGLELRTQGYQAATLTTEPTPGLSY